MFQQPSIEKLIEIIHKCIDNGDFAIIDVGLYPCMLRYGLHVHPYLGDELTSSLVRAGHVRIAHGILQRLSNKNEASWNSLITGYGKNADSRNAIGVYRRMCEVSLHPSGYALVILLKACAKLKDYKTGAKLHSHIMINGLLEKNPFIGTALVDMYAKCWMLAEAQEVFDILPRKNRVSWNALIAGYAQCEHAEKAIHCFQLMTKQDVFPDDVTYACILKAFSCVQATEKIEVIQDEIERKGILQRNVVVGTCLVDMYVKWGMLAKAQDVFDKLPTRHLIAWTSLIGGYVEHGFAEEAIKYFEEMQNEGVYPDGVTLACTLKACSISKDVEKGKEIHTFIKEKGLWESDQVVGTALVDMYAKCGILTKAAEVFYALPVHDVVCWNALIGGYAIHECGGEQALFSLQQMKSEGISPNAVTYTCGLKACSSIGDFKNGMETHASIVHGELVKTNQVVGNALIDMYTKCGMLAKAVEVFNELPIKNTISWNALITGYGQMGDLQNAFHMFYRMNEHGIEPDPVTFVCLLNACSHAGQVEDGYACFIIMTKEFGIAPTLEQYNAMVDLLGRAGQLERAIAMIRETSCHPDAIMWLTILSACQKWSNLEIGMLAFEEAIGLADKDAAIYISICNIMLAEHSL